MQQGFGLQPRNAPAIGQNHRGSPEVLSRCIAVPEYHNTSVDEGHAVLAGIFLTAASHSWSDVFLDAAATTWGSRLGEAPARSSPVIFWDKRVTEFLQLETGKAQVAPGDLGTLIPYQCVWANSHPSSHAPPDGFCVGCSLCFGSCKDGLQENFMLDEPSPSRTAGIVEEIARPLPSRET